MDCFRVWNIKYERSQRSKERAQVFDTVQMKRIDVLFFTKDPYFLSRCHIILLSSDQQNREYELSQKKSILD